MERSGYPELAKQLVKKPDAGKSRPNEIVFLFNLFCASTDLKYYFKDAPANPAALGIYKQQPSKPASVHPFIPAVSDWARRSEGSENGQVTPFFLLSLTADLTTDSTKDSIQM